MGYLLIQLTLAIGPFPYSVDPAGGSYGPPGLRVSVDLDRRRMGCRELRHRLLQAFEWRAVPLSMICWWAAARAGRVNRKGLRSPLMLEVVLL